MEIIRLDDLTVRFTQGSFNKRIIYALRDVSLSINENEAVTILGESGAGKTTLARVLLALEKPTSGKYLFLGRNVWKDRKARKLIRKEVQYIYQDPISALNPSKTIRSSLSYPIKKHLKLKGEALRSKIFELLNAVGLDESIADRYPSQLSGGQLQRVNIARAISVNPKVLIADEPVTMLDASYRIGIIDLLADLKKKMNMTLVMITHDLAIAKYFDYKVGGSKSFVIYGGRLVEEGYVSDIIKSPLHPYTKFLVSSYIDINGNYNSLEFLKYKEGGISSQGCPFNERCPYVKDACIKEFPRYTSIDGRKVACYLYGG
jgi:peptide/nickel transport system ATP-binding protein